MKITMRFEKRDAFNPLEIRTNRRFLDFIGNSIYSHAGNKRRLKKHWAVFNK